MLVIPLLGRHWPYNNRTYYFIAHDYVENIQEYNRANSLLPSRSTVLSRRVYTREIESTTPISKPSMFNCYGVSWYFDYLRRS